MTFDPKFSRTFSREFTRTFVGDSECGPVPELPIEILNSVFEYVRLQDRCAASMTCRSWHVAAWQCVSTMEFNMRHRPEQDTIIASIVRRCPNIRHVTLRDCFSGMYLLRLFFYCVWCTNFGLLLFFFQSLVDFCDAYL